MLWENSIVDFWFLGKLFSYLFLRNGFGKVGYIIFFHISPSTPIFVFHITRELTLFSLVTMFAVSSWISFALTDFHCLGTGWWQKEQSLWPESLLFSKAISWSQDPLLWCRSVSFLHFVWMWWSRMPHGWIFFQGRYSGIIIALALMLAVTKVYAFWKLYTISNID